MKAFIFPEKTCGILYADKGEIGMNLKKRLTITFLTLTFLPITLTVITFAFLCGMVSYNEDARELFKDFSLESASEITEVAEETYYEIEAQLKLGPDRFTSKEYLNELNTQLSEQSSYIIIRKGNNVTVFLISFDNRWVFPIILIISHILPPTRLFAF